MIEEYKFGEITIEGEVYSNDVEVRWYGVPLKWWRKESHLFQMVDVERALASEPEMLIFGIGESGVAKVDVELIKLLRKRGIEHITLKTPLAVKAFNKAMEDKKKVIGLFHLTC